MLNVLIANKNLHNLQTLQNCISQYMPDIRVGYIATNGKEVLDAINLHHYDIVLLDTNLPSLDGVNLLQKLSKIKQIEYKNSFVISSHSEAMVKILNKNDLVYEAFLDTESISKIISILQKFLNLTTADSHISYIRNKVINELTSIGFNLAHKGTHYLAETVVLMATTEKNKENLSKYIYPKVSEIFNKDINNIKCNITSATEAACKNITDDMLLSYFKLSEYIKPTTKMIIYAVLNKLKFDSHINSY